MSKEKNISKKIAVISFLIYLLLITWIIVFKFRLDFSSLKHIQSINLIPFKANGVVNGMKEIFINLILFVPLGMYLEFLLKERRFKLIIIFLISFIFEVMQYILCIGISDITDIIMNFIGGVFGIYLMLLLYKILSKIIEKNKLEKILGYLSIMIPIAVLLSLFVM